MITDPDRVSLPCRLIDGEICLEPVQSNDAEELFALTTSNRSHLRKWLPWLDLTRSVSDTKSFIEKCIQQQEQKSGLSRKASSAMANGFMINLLIWLFMECWTKIGADSHPFKF